jgi:hypothetical protein
MVFNIKTSNGRIMLGSDVATHGEAEKWLAYYLETYPAGKPYPNGKGAYPDFGFEIVRRIK